MYRKPVQLASRSASHSRNTRIARSAARSILAFGVLLICVGSEARAAVLTSAVVVSCNNIGNDPGFGGGIWSTSTQNWWKLWLSDGSPGGTFINGPTEMDAAISIPMTAGDYSFTAQSAGALLQNVNYYAINLFFDGDIQNPGISAFAHVQNSVVPVGYSVNTATTSSGPELNFVVPAGTLTYTSGNTTVTLVDFAWISPDVYSQDRISPLMTSPDGQVEFMGRLSLHVSTVPEPSTYALVLTGLTILGWSRWRRRGEITAHPANPVKRSIRDVHACSV